jgi:serine protease
MKRRTSFAASAALVVVAAVAAFVGPGHGLSGRSEALGDATHPYVLSSPIFSPKTGTSFTTLFTSIEDTSMSMLLRRYDAVGTLLTSQSITIGAHGSLQASPAAHSGAPLHVEIWAPKPGVGMLVTYTDSGDVARRIEPGDMFRPRSTGGGFNALSPFRICDTRTTGPNCPKGKLGPGGEIAVQFAGVGGIPAAGASAVVVNVTVASENTTGHVDAWPDGLAEPASSAVNYTQNVAIANMITVAIGTNGKIRFQNSAGQAHVILDVAGYYF